MKMLYKLSYRLSFSQEMFYYLSILDTYVVLHSCFEYIGKQLLHLVFVPCLTSFNKCLLTFLISWEKGQNDPLFVAYSKGIN